MGCCLAAADFHVTERNGEKVTDPVKIEQMRKVCADWSRYGYADVVVMDSSGHRFCVWNPVVMRRSEGM